MRPMFFEYPDDEICYTLEDQYLYGEDILVAPIYEQGAEERQVYLPEGNWIFTQDGTIVTGGKLITCHAAIDQFIAFVKEGSDVIKCFQISGQCK